MSCLSFHLILLCNYHLTMFFLGGCLLFSPACCWLASRTPVHLIVALPLLDSSPHTLSKAASEVLTYVSLAQHPARVRCGCYRLFSSLFALCVWTLRANASSSCSCITFTHAITLAAGQVSPYSLYWRDYTMGGVSTLSVKRVGPSCHVFLRRMSREVIILQMILPEVLHDCRGLTVIPSWTSILLTG